MKPSRERPTGDLQKSWALFSAGLAVILIVFGLMLPIERHGELLPTNITVRYWMLVMGAGFLQAALLCWLTAFVVQALWFLPGRDVGIEPSPDKQGAPAQRVSAESNSIAAQPPTDVGNGALIFGGLSLIAVFALIGYFMITGGR